MRNDYEHKPHIERDQMHIEVGVNLQIQMGQLAPRMESTLVGVRPGKYLIISTPKVSHPSAARLEEEGTSLVIRYLHHGNAYGFMSAVVHATTAPERLLFITHPVQVEVYELRSYPRVSCFLPARAALDGHLFNGSVTDISRTGARFAFSGDAATGALVDLINSPAHLELQFPGAVGYTTIVGNLRAVNASTGKVNLGIRFDEIEGPQLANLLSFLLDAHALPEHHGLSSIIRKHFAWKNSVADFVSAARDAKPNFALSPNECDLGKWLNDAGKQAYGRTAEFGELNATHRQLHEQVEALVKRRREGDSEGALELFNKIDIEHLSHRIAALLISADEHRTAYTEPTADTAAQPAAAAAEPTSEPANAASQPEAGNEEQAAQP